MVVITVQRNKCIGCNYCVEIAPQQFQMSKKDGKTVLINAIDKKGFHTYKSKDHTIFEACEAAQKSCPVHIITVKEI